MKYLEHFFGSIPESEKRRMRGLLSMPDIPLEQVEEAIREFERQSLKFVPNLQMERTDSESFNQNLTDILVDLYTLFHRANILGSGLHSHRELSEAMFASLEKRIGQLERKIESLGWLSDGNYSHAIVEHFLDDAMRQSLLQGLSHLFTDFLGRRIDESLQAVRKDGSIILPSTDSPSVLRDPLGNVTATIEILEQVGEGFRDVDPNFLPEHAIDGKRESIWAELLLSPGVLQIPTLGLSKGAFVKIKIDFASAEMISEFSIDPVGEYPMEIVQLQYKPHDDDQATRVIESVKNVQFDRRITLRFPQVIAHGVILTLRQEHANRNVYAVSRDQLQNRELWKEITALEREKTFRSIWLTDPNEMANPQISDEQVLAIDPAWKGYEKALKEYEKKRKKEKSEGFFGRVVSVISVLAGLKSPDSLSSAASNLRPPEKPQAEVVEAYEYVYGAREIDLRGYAYSSSGIYVSKPFQVDGAVQQVILESEETHPLFYDANGDTLKKRIIDPSTNVEKKLGEPLRRTHIEYYVSPQEESESAIWVPILPINQTRIESEILHAPSVLKPKLMTRFPIDTEDDVYLWRNEEPIPQDFWRFAPSEDSGVIDFQTIEIEPAAWNPYATYTIDYTPDDRAHTVDLEEAGIQTTQMVEYFFGADKDGSVRLKYAPYIDRARLLQDRQAGTYHYNPVVVTLNPSGHPNLDQAVHRIEGRKRAILSPIHATRDPAMTARAPEVTIANPPEAQLLNVTNYFSPEIPVLHQYNPNPQDSLIPTFEYYHDGNRVHFTETFRHDSPDRPNNFGISHGNAIIKVEYSVLATALRLKAILRRTEKDASVTPELKKVIIRPQVLS